MNTEMMSTSAFGVDELDPTSQAALNGGDGLIDYAVKAFIGYLINHADDVVKGVAEGWSAT